ncbi:hypothetical protein BKA82DRAFT_34596 [Pisolithus tinctorius]|uniref:DH domain-containing protein n=1 Tax=Pisolithus tinctorius Marx 270 TaxID=870435 RepID=A0A0C3N1M8_PISTI|nr:hypothetical protein BKA82DRAFT_34596 [Pisolithus tinctorius]KIN94984.1 hypothetical protein M404DRAFT_34596 [Pisolithus tinctorius Marx 270]
MASLISFPTSESAPIPVPSPLVYLSFRRISLPAASAPTPHRASIVSSQLPPRHEARDARRVRIITESYETEKSYFNGLDLVYQHLLSPILASLITPNRELTTLSSNFIGDIWSFHRTFEVDFTLHRPSRTFSLPLSLHLFHNLIPSFAHIPHVTL